MNGKRNARLSWEKQTIFDLNNGARITVEFNQHYGEYVSAIEHNGARWRGCNGLAVTTSTQLAEKAGKLRPEASQATFWPQLAHNLRKIVTTTQRIFR